MTSRQQDEDLYRRLGISSTATYDEVRRAYRARARECHPDMGGTPEDMRSLNEAYDTLSVASRRSAYDLSRTKVAITTPSRTEPAPSRHDAELQRYCWWAASRAIICFLLGLLALAATSDVTSIRPFWPRAMMSISTLMLIFGGVVAYSARRAAEPPRYGYGEAQRFRIYRILFWGMVAAYVGFFMLLPKR
jgi:curved DNA-binding protein CbpA